LIDQLSEFPSPPCLVLTGGDPFKRTDLFDLIRYARHKGLEVSITPSATPLVTRRAIWQLRDVGISRMAISIDGADAHTHDALRGVRGSFWRSLDILADARAAGLATQVNTTIGPHNLHQIEDLARLCRDARIELWSVFFLVPVGRARTLPRCTADQYESAFAQLWIETQRQPFAIKTTEAPHFRRFAIQHQLDQHKPGDDTPVPIGFVSTGVNDGKGIMFVNHAGVIHPSGFLPIACGVFPTQHLVDVYQNSPVFRALRDTNRLEGKCGYCEFRNICGGSRARAYAVTGNMFAEEPDCNYVPRAAVEMSRRFIAWSAQAHKY
jgi:radical SAM protein with 4Fe4S-binding SPASM domain